MRGLGISEAEQLAVLVYSNNSLDWHDDVRAGADRDWQCLEAKRGVLVIGLGICN